MGSLSYCDLRIIYPAWNRGYVDTVFDIFLAMKYFYINGDCFGWMPNWGRYVRFESYEAYLEMYALYNQ